jgi:parvulin-like peptidyl-prolyl isomerase
MSRSIDPFKFLAACRVRRMGRGRHGATCRTAGHVRGRRGGQCGGRIILYSELASRMEQARQQGILVTDSLACGELEDLLYQQLLLEQARIDSVVPDANQVDAELERRIGYFEQQIGGREKLEKFYGKSVTEIKADFRDQVQDQLLVQQMQQKVTGEVRVTPKEVERFYKDIREDSLPFINAGVEFAKVTAMARPTEEEERRVKLRLEGYRESIVKGEKDFCTVAVLYSEDPGSASSCGELGMVPQGGMMVPEFDAVALSLKDGEMIPGVQDQVRLSHHGDDRAEGRPLQRPAHPADHPRPTARWTNEDGQARRFLDSLMTPWCATARLEFTKDGLRITTTTRTPRASNGVE